MDKNFKPGNGRGGGMFKPQGNRSMGTFKPTGGSGMGSGSAKNMGSSKDNNKVSNVNFDKVPRAYKG